jgi:hypothetical protein
VLCCWRTIHFLRRPRPLRQVATLHQD